MRDTKKVITFDFTFTYPSGGVNTEGNSIVVCEPAFEHRAVFRKMQGYVAVARQAKQNAVVGAIGADAFDTMVDKLNQKIALASEEERAASAAATYTPAGAVAFFAEMGVEEYSAFADFLQKALTNARPLAFISADPTTPMKDRAPINDLVWKNIADAGGMEAVDQVLGTFASFFLDTRPAQSSSPTGGGETAFAPLGVVPQAS